jgi:hypothetical protein
VEYRNLVREAYRCASVLAALTPTEALNGNEIGMRQQPLSTACDYDLFVWIPATHRDEADGRGRNVCREESERNPEVATFGLQPGTMILTGEKSRALRHTVCARTMRAERNTDPYPQFPPSRPPPPSPPSPPSSPAGDSTSLWYVPVSIGGAVAGVVLCLFLCIPLAARRKGEDEARKPLIRKKKLSVDRDTFFGPSRTLPSNGV